MQPSSVTVCSRVDSIWMTLDSRAVWLVSSKSLWRFMSPNRRSRLEVRSVVISLVSSEVLVGVVDGRTWVVVEAAVTLAYERANREGGGVV